MLSLGATAIALLTLGVSADATSLRPTTIALLALGVSADTGCTGCSLCERQPKICAGTWSCLCKDGQPGGCGDSTSTLSCSMFYYYQGLTGTIPTELGMYKDMMKDGYLTIFGNEFTGTLPTELSGWKGNCHIWETQAPTHWTDGTIDNPNQFACPILTTGTCVSKSPGCSYYVPPVPPLPPLPPSPPLTPPLTPPSTPPSLPNDGGDGLKTPVLLTIVIVPAFVVIVLIVAVIRYCIVARRPTTMAGLTMPGLPIGQASKQPAASAPPVAIAQPQKDNV